MTQRMPVLGDASPTPHLLVAPDALGGALRAPQVAAAIGRGLERAGLAPPELCPVAGGGEGTLEVLLPALGGQTADGFGLVEDGTTAIVEVAGATQTGERVAAAVQAGVAVVVVAAAAVPPPEEEEEDGDAGGQAADVVLDAGGLRGARLVVLCEAAVQAEGADSVLAATFADRLGARLVPGASFVLDALDFDTRMRAAHAVIVGEARLDAGTLRGRVAGEIAIRARQAGVPCHAIVASNELDRFDARILDLQAILEAGTIADIEVAGEALAAYL